MKHVPKNGTARSQSGNESNQSDEGHVPILGTSLSYHTHTAEKPQEGVPPDRPLSSSERSRLHRARRRFGLTVLDVTVDLNRFTEAAMEAGLIDFDTDDRRRIAEAAADVLDEFANSATRDARRRASRGIFRS